MSSPGAGPISAPDCPGGRSGGSFGGWIRQRFAVAWRWLRSVTGDDAYERYVVHSREHHPDRAPMSRREFYLDEQRRRWGGGVNRCC